MNRYPSCGFLTSTFARGSVTFPVWWGQIHTIISWGARRKLVMDQFGPEHKGACGLDTGPNIKHEFVLPHLGSRSLQLMYLTCVCMCDGSQQIQGENLQSSHSSPGTPGTPFFNRRSPGGGALKLQHQLSTLNKTNKLQILSPSQAAIKSWIQVQVFWTCLYDRK